MIAVTEADTVRITMDEAESHLLIRALQLGYTQVRLFESDGNDRYRDLSEFTRSLCEQLCREVNVLSELGDAKNQVKPSPRPALSAGPVITDAIDAAIAAHEVHTSTPLRLLEVRAKSVEDRLLHRLGDLADHDQHIIEVVIGAIQSKRELRQAIQAVK